MKMIINVKLEFSLFNYRTFRFPPLMAITCAAFPLLDYDKDFHYQFIHDECLTQEVLRVRLRLPD